jgi:peroxiredoxin
MKSTPNLIWTLWVVIILGLGAVWIQFSRATGGQATPNLIPIPQAGFNAPDFNLEDASGKSFQLSELRGRPLIVNVWASWCPPCRAEMPALERVYQEYRFAGLEVLAVNAANQDTVDAATGFVRDNGLHFPILFDRDGRVSAIYQVRSLPSTFFIDRHGVIREVVIGGPMAESLLRIRAKQLLEPDGSAP